MTGQLHQIRIDYVAAEDRLRLLISTRDKTEYRLWLTRRFTQGFWSLLKRLMTADASVQAQDDEGARKAVLAYKHAKATPEESFEKPYEPEAQTLPLGEEPAVVTGCKVGKAKDGGGTRLTFQLADKREVGIGVNDKIVHSLAKLLADVMPTTGWGLDLQAEFEEAEAARPARVH